MPPRMDVRRARRLPAGARPAHVAPAAVSSRDAIADEIVLVSLALLALVGLFAWARELAPF